MVLKCKNRTIPSFDSNLVMGLKSVGREKILWTFLKELAFGESYFFFFQHIFLVWRDLRNF